MDNNNGQQPDQSPNCIVTETTDSSEETSLSATNHLGITDTGNLASNRSTWYSESLDYQLSNPQKKLLQRNRSSEEFGYIYKTNQHSPQHNGTSGHLTPSKSNTPPQSPATTRFVKLRNKSPGHSPFHLRAEKAASVYGDSLQSTPKKQRPRSSIFASSAIMRRPRNSLATSTLSLLNVLENKKMRSAFLDFLETEYSSENLYFWLSCEKFRKLKTEEQRMREGQFIYSQYISPNAPNQVNIDHIMRRQITVTVNSADTLPLDIFDSAKKYVFSIMENDSFPRFISSPSYKEAFTGKKGPIDFVISNFLPGNWSSGPTRPPTKPAVKNSNNNNNCKVYDANDGPYRTSPKLVRRFSFGFRKVHSTQLPKPNRTSAPELNAENFFKVEVKVT